jgi:hypothetical protein
MMGLFVLEMSVRHLFCSLKEWNSLRPVPDYGGFDSGLTPTYRRWQLDRRRANFAQI